MSEAIDHTRFPAAEDLAPFVEHFWSVSWDLPPRRRFVAQTLPHPSVHLVIEAGRGQIAGVSTGKFVRRLQGSGRVFGIKFRPAMFALCLAQPMASITNKVLAVRKVFGAPGAAFAAELSSRPDLAGCTQLATAFLRRVLPPRDPRIERLRDLVERLAVDPRLTRLDDLVALTGVNRRALQRGFSDWVGVTAKWVLDRYRLHEAVERLREPFPSLTTVALDLGYFDQAHFNHDFKAVVGTSPGAYAHQLRRP